MDFYPDFPSKLRTKVRTYVMPMAFDTRDRHRREG